VINLIFMLFFLLDVILVNRVEKITERVISAYFLVEDNRLPANFFFVQKSGNSLFTVG
jgi:hypothetical protein